MGNCCGKRDGEYQPLATDPPPSYDTSSLEEPPPTHTGIAEKSPMTPRKGAGAGYGSVSAHPPQPKERGRESDVEYSAKARRSSHPLEQGEETERKTALSVHEETRVKQVHREEVLRSGDAGGHAEQGHSSLDPLLATSPPDAINRTSAKGGHVHAATGSSVRDQFTSTTGLDQVNALLVFHQATSAAAADLHPAKASASSDQNQATSTSGPSKTTNEFQPTQTDSGADQSEDKDDVTPAENGGPTRGKAAETATLDVDVTSHDVKEHDTAKPDVKKPDLTSEPDVSEPAAAQPSAFDDSGSLSFGMGLGGPIPNESDPEPSSVETAAEVEPTSYEVVSDVAQPEGSPQNADDQQQRSSTSDLPSVESAGPNTLSFVMLPESEQPARDATSQPAAAADNVTTEVKDDITTDVKADVTADVKENATKDVKENVTTDVKKDVKEDATTAVKEEVTTYVKENVTTNVKDLSDVAQPERSPQYADDHQQRNSTSDPPSVEAAGPNTLSFVILPESEQPASHVTSEPAAAADNVTTNIKDDVTTDAKENVTTDVKEDVTTAFKEDVTTEVKEEVTTDITTAVKEEVTTYGKENVTTNVKDDVTTDVKEDVKEEVKEDAKSENKEDHASEKPEADK